MTLDKIGHTPSNGLLDMMVADLPEINPHPEIMPEFAIGGRVYRFFSFYTESDRHWVNGREMLSRGREQGAVMGEEDAQFLLLHQEQIPTDLRGKVVLAFPLWRKPDVKADFVAYILWCEDRWVQHWHRLCNLWSHSHVLVRRIS